MWWPGEGRGGVPAWSAAGVGKAALPPLRAAALTAEDGDEGEDGRRPAHVFVRDLEGLSGEGHGLVLAGLVRPQEAAARVVAPQHEHQHPEVRVRSKVLAAAAGRGGRGARGRKTAAVSGSRAAAAAAAAPDWRPLPLTAPVDGAFCVRAPCALGSEVVGGRGAAPLPSPFWRCSCACRRWRRWRRP